MNQVEDPRQFPERAQERIAAVSPREGRELASLLRRARRRMERGQPADRLLGRLREALELAEARVASRRATIPRPGYPEELPVVARREELLAAIAGHQVVIVEGETGSGKTTQLPKLCLEAGRGVRGLIGHTQPRRIAARSVAARIAEELGSPLGGLVGYQVRFHDQVGPESLIKVMTDGILLAEIHSDPDLLAYDTLIIDEAHERSLNIDFLLGYLKRLLERRPDLKLIVTSATIDTRRFAEHFRGSPVISVQGRSWPVEVRYRPLPEARGGRDPLEALLAAVDELAAEGPGDILVFLSGEREIREAAEALRKHHPPHTEVLPLFARLSVAEQNRVFQPHAGRRIVLATNVAETSLTVPGIRYVVDTGYARISRYSPRSKVQRLPIEPISRASADQRKGRCGRLGPGICIRLYSEEEYLSRPPFTEPEIRRTSLAAVILRMLDQGLGEVEAFPFVDPPERRAINDGYRLLWELGAVDESRNITPLGRELARLPLDPRLARMLLAAREEGALREVLVIATALALQDPRERPAEKQAQADAAHAPFRHPKSDFLSWLLLWEAWHEQRRHLSRNKLRRWCQERFLAWRRMEEWHDLHQQVLIQLKERGLRPNAEPASEEAIHRALLAGLVGNVGFRVEERTWAGSHGKRFQLHPASVLAKKGPKWVMSAELVETSRLFARTNAQVQPAWIERAAAHLVRREYGEPAWDERRGYVTAAEKVTLYGLTLVSGRRVHYGPIDPACAREVFIREALLAGRFGRRPPPFLAHNLALVEEIRGEEARGRRADLLVDEQALFDFYDERLPEGIHNVAAFEKWRRGAERKRPDLLHMERERLLREGAVAVSARQYPRLLPVAGMELPLEYRLAPGEARDGVTLVVPLAALNALPEERLEWLVPGLLAEKITALIRGLPKALRRNYVPAPDFAAACAESLSPEEGALLPALGRRLGQMTGVEPPADAWRPELLPPHLRMHLRVVDESGETLDEDDDLTALRRRLAGRAAESFAGLADSELERDEVREWDFGDLPEWVEIRRGGVTLRGWPALVVEGERIALRLLESREAQAREGRRGLVALFRRTHAAHLRALRRGLPGIERICLHYAAVGPCAELKEQILHRVVEEALLAEGPIRDREAWARRSEAAAVRLQSLGNRLCGALDPALEGYHRVAKRLGGALSPAWLRAAGEIREQLDGLVWRGFVARVPLERLLHYPRYFRALERRMDRLESDPARDRRLAAPLGPILQAWRAKREARPDDPQVEAFRWSIEELRVSLFAQELGTAEPVSPERLERRLKAL